MKRMTVVVPIMIITSICCAESFEINIDQCEKELNNKRYGTALEFFNKACNVKNFHSNENVYRMELLFEKACIDDNYRSCNYLGFLYEFSHYFKKGVYGIDYFTAAGLYKKACDGGIADGCWNLGHLYYNGRGTKKSYIEARNLYKKACELDPRHTTACTEYKIYDNILNEKGD